MPPRSRCRTSIPGQTLHATLATKLAGVWTTDAVRFTTSTSARFTRPMAVDGSDLGGGLAWTSILGADGYRVRLGTTPDADDLFDSGETLQSTVATPALPAGEPVYARIATSFAGEWSERAMTLSLAGAALLGSPDASVASANHVFTWTSISNAEAYLLTVGTEPGARDVLTSGEDPDHQLRGRAPAGRPAALRHDLDEGQRDLERHVHDCGCTVDRPGTGDPGSGTRRALDEPLA